MIDNTPADMEPSIVKSDLISYIHFVQKIRLPDYDINGKLKMYSRKTYDVYFYSDGTIDDHLEKRTYKVADSEIKQLYQKIIDVINTSGEMKHWFDDSKGMLIIKTVDNDIPIAFQREISDGTISLYDLIFKFMEKITVTGNKLES